MPNLIPHRHDPDMFVSRLAAVPLKEMSEHLEFPFFQIDPRPYRGIRRFGDSRGNSIELLPGPYGLPTIQDQDILIYFLSKAMAEVRAGNPVPESIHMSASELLRFINRQISGLQYASLEKSIYRLTTLTLKTNLRGGDATYVNLFHVVDRASMVRRDSPEYRSGDAMLGCSIVLSKWIREALEARRVLTLHPDYFRLRTPLEKAFYQVVRKHCGEQERWSIGLEKLHAKTGSASPPKEFRRKARNIVKRNGDDDFLDYRIGLDGDNLVASYVAEPRRITADTQIRHRRLSARTLDILRQERPDLDAGEMERKWRKWAAKQKGTCRNAQAAFLGFCRKQPAPDSVQSDGDKGPSMAAMDWWNALTSDRRQIAIRRFQICGEGHDWAFARTTDQIIGAAYRLWGGNS